MEKAKFSSRIGAMLSLVGVAVGLGNVWRFPYMMGQYGGSAFLFLYVFFVLLLGIPALIGELSLGRRSGGGSVNAFSQTLGKGIGKKFAYFITTTIFIANAYYLVVLANVIFSIWTGLQGNFDQPNVIQQGLQNGVIQLSLAILVLLCEVWVISRGLRKGIEALSKLMVPFFGLVIIYLIFHVLTLPGALEHVKTFLKPDFSALTPKNIFASMGQAFFTLSLGGTILVTYGGYIKEGVSIPKMAVTTAFGDLSAALLASLFIFPAVLVYGLNISQGYTLIFTTLPHVFSLMPGGQVLGIFFLTALLFVAFLSSLAVMELYFRMVHEQTGYSEKKALGITALAQGLLMVPCALFPEIIGTLDLIFGSGMQMLGSCVAMLAITYGLGRTKFMKAVFEGRHSPIGAKLYVWMKWVIPTALIFVLLMYVYDNLSP